MLTAPPHNLEGHPVATLAIPPVQRLTDQGTGRWTGAEPAFPVLIVDDQPVWLDWVTLHLGEIWTPAQGLTIDCAEDGAVALAKFCGNSGAGGSTHQSSFYPASPGQKSTMISKRLMRLM